jgi:NitT/TauT family transport system substrate-binding protein
MCSSERRRWRLCVVLGLLVLVGSLAVGCGGDDDEPSGGGSSSAAETTKVRVGMLPISNAAPLYLGIKKGFFKEEGLELEPVIAQSGNEIVTALVGGDFQFGFIGFVPGMAAVSKGLR